MGDPVPAERGGMRCGWGEVQEGGDICMYACG